MSDTIEGHGHCICNTVKIKVKAMSTNMGACHCRTCQRWGGGPLLTVDCASDVTFEGASEITTFQSSDWAERGFCRKCGSHLFYRLKPNNQYIMPAGLFEEIPQMTFGHQIFIEEKPDVYSFANETETMTGAEVFAKYAPK